MSADVITWLTVLVGIVALFHFFNSNDEFPIILPLFLLATGIMRYYAVINEKAEWVVVAYAVDIFNLDNDLALTALNYFFWGTLVFFLSYIISFYSSATVFRPVDSQELFLKFLAKYRNTIIGLFVFFILVNSYTKIALGGRKDIAYGVSYLYLFKLAIGGIILIMFLLYKNLNFARHFSLKVLAAIILIYAGYISYNPSLRFQFISWMVALGLIVVKNTNPLRKFRLYAIGGSLALIVFSWAGNMRHDFIRRLSVEEQFEWAIRRLEITEDQNMLDGFMMVLQVYPEHLNYHYGMEHLEILMRPIPRAWWPGKPVGGYTNKLGLNRYMPDTTVGISQTLFGSFYGEGGVIGIIIFSIIYGIVMVRLFRFSQRFNSDMRFLLKGVIVASIIPLLRGGDLPGVMAFIGMSYWPVFLLLYLYIQFLKKEYIKRNLKSKEFNRFS